MTRLRWDKVHDENRVRKRDVNLKQREPVYINLRYPAKCGKCHRYLQAGTLVEWWPTWKKVYCERDWIDKRKTNPLSS